MFYKKYQKLEKIWGTATFKQTTLTSFSTLINSGLGALFYFFVAYSLGSQSFGIFTLLTSLIAMFSGIIDLGTDQGLIRFLPRFRQEKYVQEAIMKLSLKIKLISGFTAFFLLLVFGQRVGLGIFKNPDFLPYIPLVGFGVITQLLFSYSTSVSQALERFFLWSGLFIGTNLFRLLTVLIIYQSGLLTSYLTSLIYIILPLLGFVFSFAFLNNNLTSIKGEGKYLGKLLTFNKWILSFTIVSTIGSRLEIFFTTRYLGFTFVGIYGLVQQLTSLLPQLTSAIGAVTSPKYASFDKGFKNEKYTFKALMLTGAVGLLSLAVMLPVGYIILRLVGSDYIRGFVPFIVLLLAMVIFLITSPIRDSIIYFFEKPAFFFWLGLVHLVAITLLSIYIIPKFNLIGTSVVVLFGQLLIATSSVFYFTYLNHIGKK